MGFWAQWAWLQGKNTQPCNFDLDIASLGSVLCDMSGVSESERVGSAYELGAAVADGSEPELQQLIRG